MSVVEQWRGRARDLRGSWWHCPQCGRFAPVRRLACANCGADMQAATRASLPRRMRAVGYSHSHTIVESLDQVESRKTVMLMKVGSDQTVAIALCEADASLGRNLVGEDLALVLRRDGVPGAADPVVYRRKVAAEPAVRIRVKSDVESRSKGKVS